MWPQQAGVDDRSKYSRKADGLAPLRAARPLRHAAW